MAQEGIKERQVIHRVPDLPGWAVVREFDQYDRARGQDIWSYSLVYQDETIITHHFSIISSEFLTASNLIFPAANTKAIKNLLHALGPAVVAWKVALPQV